jgi:hypothetical protein
VLLTKHHSMKAYWGSGGIAPCILDLGTRWRWVISFTFGPLYPRERYPCTHWIGDWVGPRAGLDEVMKRTIPSPCRDSYPRSSSPQPRAIPLSCLGSSSLHGVTTHVFTTWRNKTYNSHVKWVIC